MYLEAFHSLNKSPRSSSCICRGIVQLQAFEVPTPVSTVPTTSWGYVDVLGCRIPTAPCRHLVNCLNKMAVYP